MDFAAIIQIMLSVVVWSVIAYLLNYAQVGKSTSINWVMLAAYEAVGLVVGMLMTLQTGTPDMVSFLAQMVTYVPVVSFADVVLTQLIAIIQHKQTKASLSMTIKG